MLIFTFPLIISSILQLMFNAADIIVVGRWAGDNSLAAVGSTTVLINLFVNLFIGLSVGANVLVGRYYGGRKEELLSEAVHTSVMLSIVSGVGLAVAGILTADPLLQMMQSPDTVRPLAAVYMRVFFLGMPATLLYNFGSAILRAKGDTKRPLYYLMAAGVVNVVLNLFFVIKLDMDVAGVAAATVIAQCFSAALILRCLHRETDGFKLSFNKLKIHAEQLRSILRTGLPAGFQGVLFSISNVLIQSAINSFGDVTMAGSAAASNIEGFVYFSMNAFYQAAISFTSQNVGAKKYDRINPIMIKSILCVTVTGLVLGNIAYLFGNALLGIYTKSGAVIAEGMTRLAVISTTYALCGIMDVMVGVMRGLGYSIAPMIISVVGICALRIVWIAFIFRFDALSSPFFIYLSYPITWIVTLTANLICYLLIMKRIKRDVADKTIEYSGM